jgi:hypothetical protein
MKEASRSDYVLSCSYTHFYASLEAGHVTASTALKRLTGHTEKNFIKTAQFYFLFWSKKCTKLFST